MFNKFQRFTVTTIAAVLIAGTQMSVASILTFSLFNDSSPDDGVKEAAVSNATSINVNHQAYGDAITSTSQDVGLFIYDYEEGNGFTPNVNVNYATGQNAIDIQVWASTGGQPADSKSPVNYLPGFANGGLDSVFYYTFSPDAGYSVRINELQVAVWGPQNGEWLVRADTTTGTILAQGTFSTSTVQTITGTASAGFYADDLILEIRNATPAASRTSLAIDNINFDQFFVIPQPASALLLACGLMALTLRRHNKRYVYIFNVTHPR